VPSMLAFSFALASRSAHSLSVLASVASNTASSVTESRRGDGLDTRLFIVRDDRHRFVRFVRLAGSSLFQHLNLAVDTQNFCHLLLELGVAAFQIVAHLVRLDCPLVGFKPPSSDGDWREP
jgi:hypothetical protein